MHYTDTHIHLQDYKTHSLETVINSAKEVGVVSFINPSSHPADWQKVAEFADKYPQITPAFGVHPWYCDQVQNDWQQELANLLLKYPRALVGECGIDRLKNPDTSQQEQVLQTHLQLAKKYHRPLILHAVKADRQFTELFPMLPQRTIFHSFTGSAPWGREIQKHGFYIGLNFSVLRKKNAAEILKNLDLNLILLETDGPYQNYLKGKETLPQNLPLLAEQIAEIIGIDHKEFAERIALNQQNFSGGI
ncbi:MAG: TatD family hydrolase [Alphaproteobacteria bacterium]|nr:TatD family hydrolase [Alphaproteobacteria bacterium]